MEARHVLLSWVSSRLLLLVLVVRSKGQLPVVVLSRRADQAGAPMGLSLLVVVPNQVHRESTMGGADPETATQAVSITSDNPISSLPPSCSPCMAESVGIHRRPHTNPVLVMVSSNPRMDLECAKEVAATK